MSEENEAPEIASTTVEVEESAEEEDEVLEVEEEVQSVPESITTASKATNETIDASAESKHEEEEHDFGQAEIKAEKQFEDEVRKQQSSWGGDEEDEPEGTVQKHFTQGKRRRRHRSTVGNSRSGPEILTESSVSSVQEEPFVPPVYDNSDFVSRPVVTPECTLPENILRVYNSYGYDSLRPYNLHALDDDTLVYIGGNYLHFYSISKRQNIKLRRSASGYGFGHLAIHPSKKFYAVAEKGDKPHIVIYTWPEEQVHRVLKNETERGYAFVDFNPEGDLLCSLGLEPDYLLTIWNWDRERIVLHYKAYSQDVFRASFSLTHPGQLTTCGLGHIRFWKMAWTFTGLKLQGLIGRFGKTEISDVQGFAGLPDAKIVSTSEWGNMLVWDGGLIVVEVIPKGGKTCHDAEIMNILLLETGELLTIGLDGYLKLWESELVGIAETIVDETGKFPMEPIFEFHIATDAMPVSVVKRIGEEESSWLIQDGIGKIWGVNIGHAMKDNEYTPEVIFSCLGGSISAVAASCKYSMIAISNTAGHLWLIEYIKKQTLAKNKYSSGITKIVWVPKAFDPSGLHFLASFEDGHVRLLACQRMPEIGDDESVAEDSHSPFKLELIQVSRLHKARINVMLFDEQSGILYTCGDDRVIFTMKLELGKDENLALRPLSFVTAPFPVISLDLHPFKDYRMVIASRSGRVAECRRPEWEVLESDLSLNKGKLHGRRWFFTSVKSHRRREERREARKLEMEQKLQDLKKSVAERRVQGIFVEEELETNRIIEFYRRAQHEDDAADLYIPEKPCPVYSIYYRVNKSLKDNASRNFFLHLGGYDAGYIYECKCTRPEAGGFHVVPPTPPFKDDVAVRCFLHSPDGQYLIFGMDDGSLRVMGRQLQNATPQKIEEPSTENVIDLDADDDSTAILQAESEKKRMKKTIAPFPTTVFPYDLKNFVCLPMHDPNRGAVLDMAWSYDAHHLFSVAQDGTIFAYRWDPSGLLTENEIMLDEPKLPMDPLSNLQIATESSDPNDLTIEEQLQKAEKDRLWAISEQKKEKMRKKIRELKSKFRFLKQKNQEIPDEFRVTQPEFEIDPQIRYPKKERLAQDLELVYRRYEWDSARTILEIEKLEKYFFKEIKTFHMVIKDISHTTQVHTFRHRFLSAEFEELVQKNVDAIEEEEIKMKEELEVLKAPLMSKPGAVTRVYAKDLIGDYEGKKYDTKTMHQIRQLEARLQKRYERELRWAELVAQKIPDDYVDENDVRTTELARQNLGDYKLKSGDNYSGERITVAARRQRILDLKAQIHRTISGFNETVFALRDEKYEILADCRQLEKRIKVLQRTLPPDLQKPLPPIYDIDPCEEPEKMFEISDDRINERVAKKVEEIGLTEQFKKTLEKKSMVAPRPKAGKAGPKPVNYKARKLSKDSPSTLKARKAFFKPVTELGKAVLEQALQFRCFEQDQLLLELNSLLQYFKNRVEAVRNHRIDLQIDIILMSLKLITYIQELDIVKEFDSAEKAAQERFNAQKIETTEARERMERVNKRLHRVTHELARMQQAIQDVNKEAAQIIGEKNRFSDYLWKVYRKKVRPESQATDGGGDDDDPDDAEGKKNSSTSSSGDSTDSTSQDSGSDLFKLPKPKLNPNICPEQLDKGVYERVGELRSRRTQLEIESEAQTKVVQKVTGDFERANTIFNKYTGKLENIGEEVATLQRQKQARINNLLALVILRANQVQCLDDEGYVDLGETIVEKMRRCFPNLTDVVLFPKDGIEKLDKRIEELKIETTAEREKHKLGRHMLTRLREEVVKVEKEVAALQDRCRREMLAKFGKVVDLDDVCAAIINLEILDELIKLEVRRNWHYRERKKIADEIDKARDRLTVLTKENSENNVLLAILIQRQRDVDYFLWQQSKAFEGQMLSLPPSDTNMVSGSKFDFDDDSELISNEDALEEMFNLEDILTRQESRICILRETIAACKIKAGLPPLIPLKNINDDLASKFMTLNDLYAFRNKKNLAVETVYMSKQRDKIQGSNSTFPSFAEHKGASWGMPQHSAFDINQADDTAGLEQFTIEEVDEEDEDGKESDDDMKSKVSYRPVSPATTINPDETSKKEGEDKAMDKPPPEVLQDSPEVEEEMDEEVIDTEEIEMEPFNEKDETNPPLDKDTPGASLPPAESQAEDGDEIQDEVAADAKTVIGEEVIEDEVEEVVDETPAETQPVQVEQTQENNVEEEEEIPEELD